MIEHAVHSGVARLLRVVTAAVVVTLLALGCLSWTALHGYQFVTRQSPAIRRMEVLKGQIMHFDEALTMSTRMAAATGDPQWEARYHQILPQLEAAITEILRYAPTETNFTAAAKTNAAMDLLVALEIRAFKLVREGRLPEAKKILASDEYVSQVKHYADGMTEFGEMLNRTINELETQSRTRMIWGVVTSAASVPLLILGWWLVLLSARRKRVALEQDNHQLDRDNLLLDATVAQRTRELAGALNDAQAAYHRLNDSETRFRTLVGATSQIIWTTDAGGKVTGPIPSWQEFTGVSAESVLGDGWAQPFHPEDVPAIMEEWSRALASRSPLDYEARVRRRDGVYRRLAVHGVPVLSENGELREWVGMCNDVTDQRSAEVRLRLQSRALEVVDNAIVITDRETRIEWVNPAFTRLTGYSLAESVGRKPVSLLKSDRSDAAHEREKMETIASGKTWSGEQANRRKDGSQYTEATTITPMCDESGGISHYIAVKQDITQRRQAEKTAAQLAAIVASSSDSIYSKTRDGTIVTWNAAAERLYGYRADEICGKPLETIIPADRVDEYRDITRRVVRGERIDHHETIRRHKDGRQIHVSLSLSPLFDEVGRISGASAIARDISAERQVQDALRQAKASAESASRAKSEFLANMSHEIRTPMNGVVGMTELLLGTEVTAEQREYLELTRTSADAMLEVINLILDFSKLEAGRRELKTLPFSLRECVDGSIKSLALAARGKGLALGGCVTPDVPDLLTGDAGALRQVIINLAGNAIKFTERGEVVVDVTGEPAGENRQRLHVAVRDTGIGVPQDKQAMIFTAFAQADGSTTRSHGGTGLGLSICRQLAALMGGKLWVESEPGRGSTFHFSAEFEQQQQPAATQAALRLAPAAAPAHHEAPLRILLAEDNPVSGLYARKLLENRGHAVTLAANGREALAAHAAQPFDVILMDVQMPEMGGFEAVASIRKREAESGRRVPIIALTAHALPGDAERSLAAGMDDHVSKPLRLAELRAALARHVTPPTAAPPPAVMPDARRAAMLARVDNDPALLAEIAGLFEQDAGRQLQNLAAAVERGDAEAIRFTAHSLKGSAANFADAGAVAAADRLETLAQSGQLAGLDAAAGRLHTEFQRLRAELSTVLNGAVS